MSSNKRRGKKACQVVPKRSSLTNPESPSSCIQDKSHSHIDAEEASSSTELASGIVKFSPIINYASPNNTKGNLNLTGSERKIKDSAADIHNAIEKWDSLSKTGLNIIQEIANIKLSAIYEKEKEGSQTDAMPPELEGLCDTLLETYTKMRRQVDKLAKITTTLEGVVTLEKHTKADFAPLFLTWPTSHFAVTARKIHEMYSQEIDVRQKIVENIAHCRDRKTMMFYTASWLHSPYIDTDKDALLHAMLLETGHLKR